MNVINGGGVCEVTVGVCLVTQCSCGCMPLMTFVVETVI